MSPRTASKSRPRPFHTYAGRRLAPVLFTCEHASNRLPPGTGPVDRGLREVLASHWGWDPGAAGLTTALARRLGAAAVLGRWSRLWIDLNRPVRDAMLIRGEAAGRALPWNRRLSPAAVERRVLEFHTPFHAEVDRLILRHLVRDVRPTLFAVHTFTPVLDGRRRSFEAGVLFSDHPRLAYRLGKSLRHGGLRVRYNQPYSGLLGMMYSVDRHGTHHDLAFLELELNQALFRNPASTKKLASVVGRAVAGL